MGFTQELSGFTAGLRLAAMKNIVALNTDLLDVLRSTLLSSELMNNCATAFIVGNAIIYEGFVSSFLIHAYPTSSIR